MDTLNFFALSLTFLQKHAWADRLTDKETDLHSEEN